MDVYAKPRFSPVATAAAALVLGAVWFAAILVVFGGNKAPGPNSEALLFGLAALGFVPMGILAAAMTPGIGAREMLLATAVVTSATLVYGSFGLRFNPMVEPNLHNVLDVSRIMASAPGSAYIGPMWARSLIAVAALGYLQAITVSALGFMFRASRNYDTSLRFEAFVAFRYLSAKRRDARVSATALIAAIGVACGTAALIAVTSTMSGYQEEVKDKLLNTNAHLIVQRTGREFEDHDKVAQQLREIPEVMATTPFIFTGGMLTVSGVDEQQLGEDDAVPVSRGRESVLIKAIDPDQAGLVIGLRSQLQGNDIGALRPPPPGELPRMFVGKELAKDMGLKPGQEVTLISPIAVEGKRGAPPRSKVFRVAGQFSSGMSEFDKRLVYLGLDAGQEFIGTEKSVTGIEVRVRDPDRVSVVADKVMVKLGGWPYKTIDFRQMNAGIFSALKMQKLMMVLILACIIVVAAFNIASTLFMLVVEKTREIAVLKALGARDGVIMKVFVLEGLLIGSIGVVLGVVFGLLLCLGLSHLKIHIAADVYLVDTLRVLVKPGEIALIVLGAMEVALLATLYPALRAARMYPVAAMRQG